MIGSTYKDTESSSYTLTRLHARYGKDVKDDLVFRAVKPIEGGRGVPDAQGEVPVAVTEAYTNNFQGRYMILHPWTAAVTCEAPQRGRWGGPPDGNQIATSATNLAFQPRGQVQLANLVAQDVPSIGVMSSGAAPLPDPVRKPRGCGGCATGGASGALASFAMLGLLLRRRRR